MRTRQWQRDGRLGVRENQVGAQRQPRGSVLGVLLLAGMVFLTGCGTTSNKAQPWVPEKHINVPEALSVLFPGDEIEISFIGAPDLNSIQVIQRDGKINLRLIGEIQAAGKTPDGLRRELLERYHKQLLTHEATITVKSSAPIFVSGAVKSPRRIVSPFPLTVMQAIAESGGADELQAEMRSVIVIRHENGRHFGIALDLKDAMVGEQTPAFYLQPLDIVYVPRTRIAKVNQWVDQHINKLIPRVGIGFSSAGDVYYSM